MTDEDKLLVLPLGEESKLITQTIANDTARQILELLADGAMSTSAIAKKLDIPLTTAQYNVEKLIEAKLVIVEKTKYSEKGREVKLYAPAKRMIVLVPANTTRQAVMDVLKKYLVLLPLAGFVAVLVELAMTFRGGFPDFGSNIAQKAADSGPMLTGAGNVTADGSDWGLSSAPGIPPAPEVLANATGGISGQVTTSNATVGLDNSYKAIVDAGNYTQAAFGNNYDAVNRSAEAAQGLGNAAPPAASDPTGGGALIPPDLFSHYGLWFFIGCLLIIGIMMAYEVYRVRKGKKK